MGKDREGKRIRKQRQRPSVNGAANLSDLPNEILSNVIQHLFLPDIESLSLVCRRLRIDCADSLLKKQEIARNDLRDLELNSDEYGYHDFLLGILKHEINPKYVRRFRCQHACRGDEGSDEQDGTVSVAQRIGWTSEDVQIVRAAITRSLWLREIVSADELIGRMLNGDEDAVLAVTVPLLKNLAFFVPPPHAHTLKLVFVRIARLQGVAEIEDPDLWQRLPLRKLHTIHGVSDWDAAIPLVEMLHYISLPCVQRVYLDGGCATQIPKFERAMLHNMDRRGIPRSRASTVYIRNGEMWRNVAEMLVDHFAGPCVIRQHMIESIPNELEEREEWVSYRLMAGDDMCVSDPMFYYWDHCVISSERDPVTRTWREDSRHVEFVIKYRNFHYDSDAVDLDMVQYEEDMKEAGLTASPEWLQLVRWNHFMTDPISDLESLTLG